MVSFLKKFSILLFFVCNLCVAEGSDTLSPPKNIKPGSRLVLETGVNENGDKHPKINTSKRCPPGFKAEAQLSLKTSQAVTRLVVPYENFQVDIISFTPSGKGYLITARTEHESQCEQWPISVYWVVYCNPN